MVSTCCVLCLFSMPLSHLHQICTATIVDPRSNPLKGPYRFHFRRGRVRCLCFSVHGDCDGRWVKSLPLTLYGLGGCGNTESSSGQFIASKPQWQEQQREKFFSSHTKVAYSDASDSGEAFVALYRATPSAKFSPWLEGRFVECIAVLDAHIATRRGCVTYQASCSGKFKTFAYAQEMLHMLNP